MPHFIHHPVRSLALSIRHHGRGKHHHSPMTDITSYLSVSSGGASNSSRSLRKMIALSREPASFIYWHEGTLTVLQNYGPRNGQYPFLNMGGSARAWLTMASSEEEEIMKKRQAYIQGYNPPLWTSNHVDPVSDTLVQVPMVPRASILAVCMLIIYNIYYVYIMQR